MREVMILNKFLPISIIYYIYFCNTAKPLVIEISSRKCRDVYCNVSFVLRQTQRFSGRLELTNLMHRTAAHVSPLRFTVYNVNVYAASSLATTLLFFEVAAFVTQQRAGLWVQRDPRGEYTVFPSNRLISFNCADEQ